MSDLLRAFVDFLAELKRRKVYRVAVAYIVVALGALQLVDIVVPSTRLPDWSGAFFIALAVFGFPVAIMLAWAFDLTPDGVERTAPPGPAEDHAAKKREAAAVSSAPEQVRPAEDGSSRKTPEIPAADRPPGTDSPSHHDPHPRSLAVLPFETLGENEATPFTDAIHGDVLTRLSGVSDLHVISRISVLQYRNPQGPLRAIAEELGVAWILGGEVQEIQDRVQVNARLVNAREDRQVWAESYQEELTPENLFQIQAQVTRKIADAMHARLTDREERAVDHSPTEDLGAFRLQAEGRAALDQRTEEGMRKAMDFFRRALQEDDGYALAWVGLADALTLLHGYGYEDAKGTLVEAEAAITKALDLDPTLAAAHASRGLLHTARKEGTAAIRELETAAALQPSYAEAHNWSAWVHQLLGNREEALESARQAVRLNPLSREAVGNLSLAHLTNREYGSALREARKEQELGSPWASGRFLEALAHFHLGRLDDAIAILDGLTVPWAGQGAQATLALAHAASGNEEVARAILDELDEEKDAFARGLVLAGLGRVDDAWAAFRDVRNWDADWPTLAVHHLYPKVLDPLRDDPRFHGIQEQVRASWRLQPAEERTHT